MTDHRPAPMFTPPPRTFSHLLARVERETTARLRDHSTAQTFTLRAQPPPTYTAAPLFDHHEPDRGPEPLPGQITLDTSPPPPTAPRFQCPRHAANEHISACPDWPRCTAYPRSTTRELRTHRIPCQDKETPQP